MNDYNFGNFVCFLREKKGLTQADIAEQLGVTPAAVSKWENGSSKPRVEVLFRLAEILDVRPDELMAGQYIPEETLNPEAVSRINERYEYLRKIDAASSTQAKLRRLAAWIIDWNVIGFSVLILIGIAAAILKEHMTAGHPAAILTLVLLILSYPVVFIMRDLIFVRSLGKRIMGLVVLDKQTGQPAKAGKRLVRELFLPFMQFDAIILLITGRTIGDHVAHTVVVPKKELEAIERPENQGDQVERINAYHAPAPWGAKKILLLIGCIVGAIVLFVCLIFLIVSIALSSAKNTEEYGLAYTYLVESQTFKEAGIDEEDIRFQSYSSSSHKDANGEPRKDAEIGFGIGHGKTLYVICHFENGEWQVCEECTHFD